MQADVIVENSGESMVLNGFDVADAEKQELIHEWLYSSSRARDGGCPGCGSPLHWADKDGLATVDGEPPHYHSIYAAECHYCTFWNLSMAEGDKNDDCLNPWSPSAWYISKVREFDSIPEHCHAEMAQHLRRHPSLWHSMSPERLEKLVAAVYKANYCDAEVLHVGRPSDGGVDVVFVDSGSKQWLIQVKRRENPASSEEVSTLRNLLGAMVLRDSRYGIVVSTADHFTYQALRAKGRAHEVGYEVSLVDRGKLARMIDPLLPDREWLSIIYQYLPEWVSYFKSRIESRNQLLLF